MSALRNAWLKSSRGFTLMELMVALAVSSILMLSAMGLYVQSVRMVLLLQAHYQDVSRIQILQMQKRTRL